MSDVHKLPAQDLKFSVDREELVFQEDYRPLNILGQGRAQSALQFGVAMHNSGYNIYVMGEPGSGRLSMVSNYLRELSAQQETPHSIVYVDNFSDSREPVALHLPPGKARPFSQDIEQLIEHLLATFPGVFENPAYQRQKNAMEQAFNRRYNDAVDKVEKKSQVCNIALYRDSETISFAPFGADKVMDEEQFTRLPQQEREQFHQQVARLEAYLSEVLLELPLWRREMDVNIKQLEKQTIITSIHPLFKALEKKYRGIPDVIAYLSEIKKNLLITLGDFFAPTQAHELPPGNTKRELLRERYLPNIVVDHLQNSGAPVIYEPHPIYQNLFGRVEYVSEQGTLVTGYRRICVGSLHKANGGYLILDADKLLDSPFVWDGIKRALKSARIEITAADYEPGVNTVTLKPEVIPLNIKVILLGSRDIYYLLQELDSEFNELFRVLADFDDDIPRNSETMRQFAGLMIHHAASIDAKPLTRGAIERLLEHSCRLSENQQSLSCRINDSLEIISEAEFLRKHLVENEIAWQHIEQAIIGRELRNGRMAETQLREMLDGTLLINTEGTALGKVNGLTVMEVGESHFGAPTRISVTVYPGSRGIVDIEREAELGQSIHSKGVLILNGYLGHCYAQQFPLAISANIAIEQSYGHIDGDSASLAELCALISALTRTPINQGFALTGSINQYGEVQAVGGVNEKIESFFALCKARELSGEQAVIIPQANQRNLMLKQEVIDAVRKGLFSIYSVATVNATLELLTGIPAGIMDAQGQYPENSINHKVILRLREISEMTSDRDEYHEHD